MKEHDQKNDAPMPTHAGEEEIVDDMDYEPEEELGSIGAAQAKIKKLRAELKETQQKRDEYLAGWQREKADAINLKKEAAHDAIRMAARVKANLIEDLLPSLDSFDMAYGSPSWESVDPTWRGGIDGIRNQLIDMLSKNGISRFGSVGDMLDPYLHEAVQEVSDARGERADREGSAFWIQSRGLRDSSCPGDCKSIKHSDARTPNASLRKSDLHNIRSHGNIIRCARNPFRLARTYMFSNVVHGRWIS